MVYEPERITVVRLSEPDVEYVFLVDLKLWLDGTLESMPEQYRGTAVLDVGSESYITTECYYTRPETEQDRIEKQRNTEELEKKLKDSDLQKLRELKAKYE